MKTLILFLLFPVFLKSPEITENKRLGIYKSFLVKEKKEALYEAVILHIKQREGLKKTVYLCPAGQKTIGYGHAITKKDNLPDTITEKQADSILRIDFNQRMALISELEFPKRLAIASFIYNLGFSAYYKGTLRKYVNSGKDISCIISKYSYYRKNGKYIFSKHIWKTRKFELKIYYTSLL